MIFRVKGIKRVRSKGRVYYYDRKSGKRIHAPPGTPAFFAEIEQLRGAVKDRSSAPGSLGGLIEAYRGSPEFVGLAPRTRADYQRIFDYLRKIEDMPLYQIDEAAVLRFRDRAFEQRKRRFANYVAQIFRLLFAWGKPRGLVPRLLSEVTLIRKPRGEPVRNRRWTRDEVNAVLAAAPAELKIPIALAVCTGMRQGDVLRFPWSGYEGGMIIGRASKTDVTVEMPAHPLLRELLDAAPRRSPVVVVGAKGMPYTQNGFRARFFQLLRRLQAEGSIKPGLTFHGLRTTTATMLAEAGCDTQTIMAITGHKTEAIVAHYTRDASRKGRAKTAIRKLKL